MKDKLIYILIFSGVFVLVTAALIYLNNNYKNIFEFDFTPVNNTVEKKLSAEQKENSNISPDSLQYEIVSAILDSIKSIQQQSSNQVTVTADSAWQDSIKKLENKINELSLKKFEQRAFNDSIQKIDEQIKSEAELKDSSYKAWIKKSVALFETMDTRKAAKIIQTYSDNVAKDLLYSMKKKKAAEILAQYSPEFVNRIIKPR